MLTVFALASCTTGDAVTVAGVGLACTPQIQKSDVPNSIDNNFSFIVSIPFR